VGGWWVGGRVSGWQGRGRSPKGIQVTRGDPGDLCAVTIELKGSPREELADCQTTVASTSLACRGEPAVEPWTLMSTP